MSSRGLLLALLGCSSVGLAAIGLLIRAERATTAVHAASPDAPVETRPVSDIDPAPEAAPRVSGEEHIRRLACRGRVLGDFGDGAERVAVEIGVVAADAAHVLAHVQSGPRGAFHCDLGIPSELADSEDAHLFARIEHDGYPRRLIRRPIATIDFEVVFRLSLGLRRVLPGSVVDAKGAPVAGALVELRTDGQPGIDAGAKTEKDGTFEMTWRRPGTYRLSARADGCGSTQIPSLTLSAESEPDPLRIELASPDVLEGRVEDTEGRPISGEELWAFPASLAGSSSESLFRWRTTSASEAADGVRSGFTTSEDDGSFRFVGFSPGTYFIAPRGELDETTIATRIWRAGDRDVRLVVERWWLEIQGPPSRAGRVFCTGLYQGRGGGAIQAVESEKRPGSVIFPVEGGRAYLYGWIDEGHAVVEDTVLIPWDRPRTVLEIREGASVTPGALQIALMTLDQDDARRARLVSVRSRASGFELWNWSQRGEGAAHLLAPGRYGLRVSLQPTHSFRDGTPGFETLLVTESEIEIRSGETTKLDLWR